MPLPLPLPLPAIRRSTPLLATLALAGMLWSAPAKAQDRPAGSVQAHFLASPEEDFGAAVSADLWFPIDDLRLGGFFGVGAVPSAVDARNRVFMPLGVSVAFEPVSEDVGVSLRVRGGLWGGATQDAKLTVGGFVGGAAYLLFPLGGGTTLGVGIDVWGLFGDGDTVLFAPGLALTWNPVWEPAVDEGG